MALRAGYKGFKKLLPGLKIIRPGTLGIDNDVLIPELNKKFFPRSEQALLGAKNLLKLTGSSTTKHTVNITIDNETGTVSVNGTSDADYADVHDLTTNFTLPKGSYTLNGTPDGVWTSNNGFYLQLYNVTDSTVIAHNYSGDTTFTLNADKTVKVRLYMGASASISNKVFYPMIRLASDPDDTYVPYAMTNKELTEKVKDFECDKTAAGTYTLSATVDAQGAVTYAWTAVTP